ncbi:dihydrolipoyl dehydrogenase family protein [Salinisphaera hydrothermalis]|uniref:Pyridine nucleotide-disulfide oxidoreductase dimerization region n=1 Tax=Salinisphaera hydrothermalis (strain C41B8) TaxID=1304275 RepID=A0A084IH47_SALHC|nr:NAD(P)/FAD-dependent oxidoreductase [Salinisphaera hydrothermalis]KEZ76031.1 pyridine nucleotide-disulfide oxidoreductase dimerization region [Salinisphaera hydrothermalis C41B8]
MAQSFDLIAIGVGMAAVSAAHKCAAAGWSVAVVDELPYGGTCALRGCDPKKILRRGAEIIDAAQLMQGKGIEEHGLRINWSDLVAHKRSFTEKMPDTIENGLEKNGITTLHGSARFVDNHTIEVEDERFHSRYVLVATGAIPRPIDIPGAEHLIDNERFMALEALPDRLLFVGGGYISFEFAHMAARAGAHTTIIDRGDRPLKAFDPDLVDQLVARSTTAGIDFRPGTTLKSIEKTSDGFVVIGEQNGKSQQWTVDRVVHGAGRAPGIEALDPAAAHIEAGPRGVVVNEYLQSVSNPAVYAAGDAADTTGLPLTPVAVFEGKVAASNMLKGNHKTPDYRGVPSVVFTVPALGRVGMLESEARDAGHDVNVKFTDTSGWFSNRRIGEPYAAVKIIVDNASDEILGAHLFGPGYAELINIFALAIKLGLKVSDLKTMVPAYPTVGSDLGAML